MDIRKSNVSGVFPDPRFYFLNAPISPKTLALAKDIHVCMISSVKS